MPFWSPWDQELRVSLKMMIDRFSRANNIHCTVPTDRVTSSRRQVSVRLLGSVGLRCTFLSQPGILLRIFCTSNRTGMRTPNRSVVRLRVRRPIVTSRAPDGTNPSNLDLNSVRRFGCWGNSHNFGDGANYFDDWELTKFCVILRENEVLCHVSRRNTTNVYGK